MLIAKDWKDYQLLARGRGRKLERFGPYQLSRPEPRALWKPVFSNNEWLNADAKFVAAQKGGGGSWKKKEGFAGHWQMVYKDLRFICAVESSKQTRIIK